MRRPDPDSKQAGPQARAHCDEGLRLHKTPAEIVTGRRSLAHLAGLPIPSACLWFLSRDSYDGLASYMGRSSFVVYFYNGIAPDTDLAQAQGFRDHSLEWAALGYGVLGISTQAPDALRRWARQAEIPYHLASDTSLALAALLGLPIIEVHGVHIYERLMLVMRQGRLEQVVYPILDHPAKDAARVSIRLHNTITTVDN